MDPKFEQRAYDLLLAFEQKCLTQEMFEIGKLCQSQVSVNMLGSQALSAGVWNLYQVSASAARDLAVAALNRLDDAIGRYDEVVAAKPSSKEK